jgi:hypothetical protein
MTADDEIHHPDAECRRQYLRIHQRTWRSGLDFSKIQDSKFKHCVERGAETEVTVDAYRPTGVALGHPLPCLQTTRRLYRLAKLVDRSHFDHGPVFDITRHEQRQAAQVIAAANTGRVTIDFNGFLLSSDGRLLVRGYPQDERLFHLRQRLAEALPADAGPPSVLAHIKLGHVLVCPSLQQVRELSDWLGRCSHHLSKSLVFEDVFSPVERMKLTS